MPIVATPCAAVFWQLYRDDVVNDDNDDDDDDDDDDVCVCVCVYDVILQ